MKTVIFCLVAVVFAFSSCKKTRCYECTMFSDNGYTEPTSETITQCDWTEKQMQEQTKKMSKSWDNGGHLATEILTCIEK